MYKLSVYNNIYLLPANSAPTNVGGEGGREREGEEKERGRRAREGREEGKIAFSHMEHCKIGTLVL